MFIKLRKWKNFYGGICNPEAFCQKLYWNNKFSTDTFQIYWQIRNSYGESQGTMTWCLGHWSTILGVPGSKPVSGLMVNSAFHPSEDDQMSKENLLGVSGFKTCPLGSWNLFMKRGFHSSFFFFTIATS